MENCFNIERKESICEVMDADTMTMPRTLARARTRTPMKKAQSSDKMKINTTTLKQSDTAKKKF